MAAPVKRFSTRNSPPTESTIPIPSIYDTYLYKELSRRSPDPDLGIEDNYETRLKILQSSAGYFLKQDRIRAVERLQLETARLYMQEKQWANAIRIIKPLWQTLSWRRAGWWRLVEEVACALRECARMMGDSDTLIAVEWELLNECRWRFRSTAMFFTASSLTSLLLAFTARTDWQYDFSKCLEGLAPSGTRPKSVVQAENIRSCCESKQNYLHTAFFSRVRARTLTTCQVSVTFAFTSSQGYVGKKMSSHLIISSRAHEFSTPITLKQVKIACEGSLKYLEIQHDPEEMPEASTEDNHVLSYNVLLNQSHAVADESTLSMSDSVPRSRSLVGPCDLTIAPGVTKALSLDIVPRDSGDLEAIGVTLRVEETDFDFEIVAADKDLFRQEEFWFKSFSGLSKKRLRNENSSTIKILPKPPKMRIDFPNLKISYFSDELVMIDVHITNEENMVADVTLKICLLGSFEKFPDLQWSSEAVLSDSIKHIKSEEETNHHRGKPTAVFLGQLALNETRQTSFSLQADSEAVEYTLEIQALYHVVPDPDTPITKTVEVDLVFIRPFEAHYSLSPRFHPNPWPNYFNMDGNDEILESTSKELVVSAGLYQNWSLTARIVPLGTETLVIENVKLLALEEPDDAVCKITHAEGAVQGEVAVVPANVHRRKFDLEVQKHSLEDSQSTILNQQLQIQWRRDSPLASSIVTHVTVPELVIPFGEPRVLALARNEPGKESFIQLEYMIENPSMYILTFSLTMETSDEFAFSGAKTISLQLVPLSRHTVRYRLLPLVQGQWISPQFKVMDVHFNKTLKVHATEGIRSDAKGTFIWVDADD